MKKVFKILLLAAGMPLAMSGQNEGPAGADKLLCAGGSIRLGPQTPCTDCCYMWSPVHHLDDPNAPNPTVSGLSESTIYAVTVSMPDGNYESDFVTVYTYSMDMAIFKPKFLSSNPNVGEQMVSDSQEESPGAQTMVNIDNDDCDDQFDREDLLVAGGDDEFVKLRVRMTVDLPMFANAPGTAQRLPPVEFKAVVLANNGLAQGVRLWRSNDKSAGLYNLGDALVLTTAGENAYEAFVWVEGVSGHTAPRQAQFKARAFGNEDAGCMNEDVVSLTVVGVDKIEWVGQENGYTGDGKNNSNTLDDVGGPARTQRVFPEGKLNGNTVSPAKTTVTAVITLSTPVVEALPLYLRTFDVDDPSDETTVIDPNDLGVSGIYQGSQGLNYDPDNDNRGMIATSGSIDPSNPGASSAKFGAFSGSGLSVTDAANGIYKQTVTAPQKLLSANFEVAKYPGDNYRFAVYGDLDFLKKLRNRDQYDKHKLVDRCTGINEGCQEIDQKYESPILAVWRTLHIEHDLMRKANDDPGNENQELRAAYFTDFELDGGGPKISAIKNVLNENGTAALLNDGSISPAERFEGGAIKLGNKPFLAKSITATAGQNVICINTTKPDFSNLNCRVVKSGLPDLNLAIFGITKPGVPYNYLVRFESVANLADYAGGMVYFGGELYLSGALIAVPSSTTSFGLSNLKIPIRLKDDDYLPLLPYEMPASMSATLKTIYQAADIDPVFDGGGKMEYVQNDLDFQINVTTAQAMWDTYYTSSVANSKPLEKDDYWIANVVFGWQGEKSMDHDPKEETSASLGLTPMRDGGDCTVTSGWDVSYICTETLRDVFFATGDIEDKTILTTAHEIGHQFGLTHGFPFNASPIDNCATCIGDCVNVGLMSAAAINLQPFFIPFHINLLRSRTKAPKQ